MWQGDDQSFLRTTVKRILENVSLRTSSEMSFRIKKLLPFNFFFPSILPRFSNLKIFIRYYNTPKILDCIWLLKNYFRIVNKELLQTLARTTNNLKTFIKIKLPRSAAVSCGGQWDCHWRRRQVWSYQGVDTCLKARE